MNPWSVADRPTLGLENCPIDNEEKVSGWSLLHIPSGFMHVT
jgi:hypothetical protein